MRILDSKSNFLALDKKYSSLEKSAVVIVPAPFERSTSYGKGTVNGPKAILAASAQVEFYDDEFNRKSASKRALRHSRLSHFRKSGPKTC